MRRMRRSALADPILAQSRSDAFESGFACVARGPIAGPRYAQKRQFRRFRFDFEIRAKTFCASGRSMRTLPKAKRCAK
jgi:hypothetical protein